jgi:hypothetical protein
MKYPPRFTHSIVFIAPTNIGCLDQKLHTRARYDENTLY